MSKSSFQEYRRMLTKKQYVESMTSPPRVYCIVFDHDPSISIAARTPLDTMLPAHP